MAKKTAVERVHTSRLSLPTSLYDREEVLDDDDIEVQREDRHGGDE